MGGRGCQNIQVVLRVLLSLPRHVDVSVHGVSGPISYQWQRNGINIAGATGSTYATTQADVGSAIGVVASYIDNQGTAESVSSAPTTPVTNVNDAPSGAISIDNMTPTQGDVLTAHSLLADADGLSGTISYQWRRDGLDIAGATSSTYTATQADVGATLAVVVTYTDDAGTTERSISGLTDPVKSLSSPTSTVAGTSPPRGSDPPVLASATGETDEMQAVAHELVAAPEIELLPYVGSSHHVVVVTTVADPGYLVDSPPATPPLLQRIAINFGAGQRGAVQFLLNEVQPPVPVVVSPALAAALDELAENSKATSLDLHMTGAVAASVSLSAGVVAWMLRSGALLAGLVASKPAWAQFDPLPIFDRRATDDDPLNPQEQPRADKSKAEERP